MGFGRFVHLVGSVFLLAATALLIVASVSAPVVNQLAILKVDLDDSQSSPSGVNFGTFGYCLRGGDGGDDDCSGSHIGYDPAAEVLDGLIDSDFSDARADTVKALTNVMVLHPVGAGVAFVAFLLSVLTGIVGGFLSALVAVVAFIITAVALICDFVGWTLVRNELNDRSGTKASYGPAIYCVLAAAILSLIAAVLVFITCCAGRRSNGRHAPSGHAKGEKAGWWNNPNPWEERRMIWNPRGKW